MRERKKIPPNEIHLTMQIAVRGPQCRTLPIPNIFNSVIVFNSFSFLKIKNLMKNDLKRERENEKEIKLRKDRERVKR